MYLGYDLWWKYIQDIINIKARMQSIFSYVWHTVVVCNLIWQCNSRKYNKSVSLSSMTDISVSRIRIQYSKYLIQGLSWCLCGKIGVGFAVLANGSALRFLSLPALWSVFMLVPCISLSEHQQFDFRIHKQFQAPFHTQVLILHTS